MALRHSHLMGSRILLNHVRGFSMPSVYLLAEFFHPQQPHMVAVSDGLRLCYEIGNFSSYAAAIAVSTLLLRSAIASPIYTYSEKNQALVALAYFQSHQTVSTKDLSVGKSADTTNNKFQKSLVFILNIEEEASRSQTLT